MGGVASGEMNPVGKGPLILAKVGGKEGCKVDHWNDGGKRMGHQQIKSRQVLISKITPQSPSFLSHSLNIFIVFTDKRIWYSMLQGTDSESCSQDRGSFLKSSVGPSVPVQC